MDDPTLNEADHPEVVDPMDDPFAVCEMIADCVNALDQRGPVGSPMRRVELWQAVDAVRDALTIVCGQVAADAVDALVSQGVEEARTSFGPVHLEDGYVKEQWRGFDLINDLSEPVINGDGERVRAVPVDVLRQVVPACSEPEHTSSKWKATGLVAVGLRPRDYRTREEEPPKVIRKGRGTR